VLAGVTVNADPRANALIVSAPPESMPLIAALIAQLDQPPDAIALLKVFTIKNGDAVSLAQMLQDSSARPGAAGWRRRWIWWRRRFGAWRWANNATRSSNSASPSTNAPTASSPPAAKTSCSSSSRSCCASTPAKAAPT
jgi:hypothetical protein